MSKEHRLRVVELEAEKEIASLGFEPTPIMPLVREAAEESPGLAAKDIVAILRSENAAAFKPRTVETKPAEIRLSSMTESEKMAFIASKGLDAYGKLIARESELRRAELQRQSRKF